MRRWLSVIMACVVPGALCAQVLRDPTQPPAAFMQPAAAEALATDGELRLDGIRRMTGGAPTALINGAWVAKGDEVAGRRVLQISENSVTLRGESGKEVLMLAPSVQKQNSKAEIKATARRAGGER